MFAVRVGEQRSVVHGDVAAVERPPLKICDAPNEWGPPKNLSAARLSTFISVFADCFSSRRLFLFCSVLFWNSFRLQQGQREKMQSSDNGGL